MTRLDTLTFEKELGDFVQILNSNGNHWICISNLGCKPGVVEVFDSMCTGEISIEVEEGIILLLCVPHVQLLKSYFHMSPSRLAHVTVAYFP